MAAFISSLHSSVVRAFAFKLTGPEFNPHHGQSEIFFREITFYKRFFHPLQFILMLFWECILRKSRYKRVFRQVDDLHWLSYVYYGEIMGPHHFEVNNLTPHTGKNSCQKVAIKSWHASKGPKLVKNFDLWWISIVYVVHATFHQSVSLQRIVIGSKIDWVIICLLSSVASTAQWFELLLLNSKDPSSIPTLGRVKTFFAKLRFLSSFSPTPVHYNAILCVCMEKKSIQTSTFTGI